MILTVSTTVPSGILDSGTSKQLLPLASKAISCLQSFELSVPQNLHFHFTLLNIVHVFSQLNCMLSLPTRVSSHRRLHIQLYTIAMHHSHLRNHFRGSYFWIFSSATTQYLRFSRDMAGKSDELRSQQKKKSYEIQIPIFHLNKTSNIKNKEKRKGKFLYHLPSKTSMRKERKTSICFQLEYISKHHNNMGKHS